MLESQQPPILYTQLLEKSPKRQIKSTAEAVALLPVSTGDIVTSTKKQQLLLIVIIL